MNDLDISFASIRGRRVATTRWFSDATPLMRCSITHCCCGIGVHAELGEDVALARQDLGRAGQVAGAQRPEDVDVGGVLDPLVVGRSMECRHGGRIADVELLLDAPGQTVGQERRCASPDRCS